MVQWQMDQNGSHRIVDIQNDNRGTIHTTYGPWTTYTGIATLTIDGRLYIAVTDYFAGSMPTEQVLIAALSNMALPNITIERGQLDPQEAPSNV